MIYLSHNYKDSAIVTPIANRLAKIFGDETIIRDAWMAQPGECIKSYLHSEGGEASFFLLFVSANSLQGDLMNFEWQNAVIKATAGTAVIVPIRMDESSMPPVLRQNLYIDFHRYGLEVTLRQLIDVIEGNHAFRNPNREFSNLRAYTYIEDKKSVVECHADYYLEPTSSFLVILSNKQGEVYYEARHPIPAKTSFHKGIVLGKDTYNAVHIGSDKGTAPGFPVILDLIPINAAIVRFVVVMHEHKLGMWQTIPTVYGRKGQ